MDLLDRLLAHDAWTTRQLLVLAQALTDDQLDRDFDIGLRSVRATFWHIIRNVEVWSDLMLEVPVRDDVQEARSINDLLGRLDRAAADFARLARSISARSAWDARWIDPLDGIEKSYGAAIAHVITHSMHHRAQILYMLRLLGVDQRPEGDVLSWEQHHHSTIRDE